MITTRRGFLSTTTGMSAGFVIVRPAAAQSSASESTPKAALSDYSSGIRMAATPATNFRAYRSKPVPSQTVETWVQIDLGRLVAVDAIQLFPASEHEYPGRDQYYAGEGFPLRFKIEASREASFEKPATIADLTGSDFPFPGDLVTQFKANGARARFVRLTATQLRPVKIMPAKDAEPVDAPNFSLTLAKIGVLSGGTDVAVGCTVTVDSRYGNLELASQLTRPARQDGENLVVDHPENATDPATWKRVQFSAQAPRSGVSLQGGIFQTALKNNVKYLLSYWTTEDLLRQFHERTGQVTGFKPTGSQKFWEEDLAGSNAGRFLMGAGNALRWVDAPELRSRLNAVVSGIKQCREANGYIMAYPADTVFYSERAAYTRAWLTHGLLEAGYAGNPDAFALLRGYYDWFNQQSFLPQMLRGVIQGGQGMIANTRVCLSPGGKPADAQVIQRYFQENAWLEGLAKRETNQIWQYPYDRPHCYLLTNLEAYLDMYLITGDRRYYDAVLGAWEMYRAHWQQAGGSISIIEFKPAPPDSNRLQEKLGELCGSAFWVFLSQRFQQLDPDNERYATEIEHSIYNVALANQDEGNGLRYHTILEGKKEKATHENTCCEGQGSRLLGSLPEHIYLIAADGVYINLFEPSTITWQQRGSPMTLTMQTRFPFEPQVRVGVGASSPTKATLRIRVPSWAERPMAVSVNGQSAGEAEPGSYLSLDRKWSDGDRIEFTLPVALRCQRYTGTDQIEGRIRYAFLYGPILLAAVGGRELPLAKSLEPEQIVKHLKPVPDNPLCFILPGSDSMKLMPYWQIKDEEFTCLPSVAA